MRLVTLVALFLTMLTAVRPARAEDPVTRRRLAVEFGRAARVLVDREPVTVRAIESSLLLLEKAISLEPDDVGLWRFAMKLAVAGERDELYERALKNVVRLDPDDDVARLRRIDLAIDRHQTTEERIEAYGRFLAPENRDRIGPAVASRLMLDLALLHRRRGDIDEFADALAEAVVIDSSNRAAAALAAGFFRMNVDDPYAEAELLVNVVLADPTDRVTEIALARLLLENGAYRGAERLYHIAVGNNAVLGQPPASDLLADHAIAMWGSGNAEAALRMVRERQQLVDEYLQAQTAVDDPALDPLERARLSTTVGATLATVRAAITTQRGAPEARAFVELALNAYEQLLADESITASETAELTLEMAWIAVWLGGDPDRIASLLLAAEQFEPLAPVAQTRFDGWRTLRAGDAQGAAEILSAVADTDLPAALGLAESRLMMGQNADAARTLLVVARRGAGSLIGVWATNRLVEILDRRLPLSDDARRLEALIDTIPRSFDSYPQTPSLAVGFRLEPERMVVLPYEPLIVNIEITNNSSFPLALDRDGPIRPQVVLLFSTTIGQGDVSPNQPPLVIDIGRRLRLEPRERLLVPVDLLRYGVGTMLTERVRAGLFLRVKGFINFNSTAQGAILPSLLGGEDWTATIRLDGAKTNVQWMEDAFAILSDPTFPRGPEDLVTMGLLGDVINLELLESAPARLFKLFSDTDDALVKAFARLDDVTQAWVLAVTPRGKLVNRIRMIVERNGGDTTRIAYLLYHLDRNNDPVLVAALSSSDKTLRTVAERFVEAFEQAAMEQAAGG